MFRTLRLPLAAFGLLIALIGATAPVSAAATDTIQVSGTSAGEPFAAVIVDAAFITDHGNLVLIGQLQGTVTIDGEAITVDQQLYVLAAADASSTCTRIDLLTSPIAIDEHGIQVQLDTVSLDKPETGLLGGLFGPDVLCAVDDLLDGNPDSNALADVLNDLIGK